MRSLARRLSVGTTASAVAMVLAIGAVPAQAAELPSHARASGHDRAFDSAQRAMGLSSEDAPDIAPGVQATADRGGASVSLGDFEVKISAPDDKVSSTTILPDGARVMSMLERGDTSVDFQVDVPDGASLAPRDGGYDVVVEAAGTKLVLGRIAQPWAVDANGKELPTSYTVGHGTLTQTVDTNSAAFPVVADPALTLGWGKDGPGVYWNMYGYQAKALAAASVALVVGGLAGGCSAAAYIPKVGKMLAAACFAVGAPNLKDAFSAISKTLKSTRVASTSCYSMRIPTGSGLHKVDKGYCA